MPSELILSAVTIGSEYDISYTGLVHISGTEYNLSVDEYRDKHRVLVTKKISFKIKTN